MKENSADMQSKTIEAFKKRYGKENVIIISWEHGWLGISIVQYIDYKPVSEWKKLVKMFKRLGGAPSIYADIWNCILRTKMVYEEALKIDNTASKRKEHERIIKKCEKLLDLLEVEINAATM